MKKIKLKYTPKKSELSSSFPQKEVFQKYVSPTINFANSFKGSQTGPKKVGQLTEMMKEFRKEEFIKKAEPTVDGWEKYYLSKNEDKMENAKKVIWENLQSIIEIIQTISKEEVDTWVKDLIINKTFYGLDLEEACKWWLAKKLGIEESNVRSATPAEESKGIDFWIKNIPFQCKIIDNNSPTNIHKQIIGNDDIDVVLVKIKRADNKLQIDIGENIYNYY